MRARRLARRGTADYTYKPTTTEKTTLTTVNKAANATTATVNDIQSDRANINEAANNDFERYKDGVKIESDGTNVTIAKRLTHSRNVKPYDPLHINMDLLFNDHRMK